ncbi:hypothetical protein [Nocardia sp. NRRL S-836]|uniref:hypothetical protein n=1 Tax=Nocardia sp. NRRL S-836 TaxID=1519492 RepID=UPI0006AED47F|nr:hypothetical protein [Nocardia sp. NRRL S-836]KOV81658.1 hypothetical protein ADL03_27960 [Nocardia sp. NRRL S-836]
MRGTWNVPFTGVLLGITVLLLADPLIPGSAWWLSPLLCTGVATVSTLLISFGVNTIPGASARFVAGLTSGLLLAATVGSVVATPAGTGSTLEAIVPGAAPFLLFRAVVATADMLTPSFTVSLLAGLTGTAVYTAAVPLVAAKHPGLSLWACLGIAAVIGYVEGMLVGAALRPLFAAESPAGGTDRPRA